jgi:formylglycine-generating enzyme required for sulfatase activity
MIEPEMIYIPAGSFLMGSEEDDSQAYADERPQHQVTIKEPFYIGKYPITQEQYEAVMENNPSYFKKEGKYPVESVGWHDAQEFCQKLSNLTEKTYRLPSEAEWEYACRAGTQSSYYYGNDENQLVKYAWYNENSNSQTQPVGQKKPNQWGLYDMLGNVWEWCEDDWHYDYNGAPNDGKAWIDNDDRSQSEYRIMRGGAWNSDSWNFNSRNCRCATRNLEDPAWHTNSYGFRVVLVK